MKQILLAFNLGNGDGLLFVLSPAPACPYRKSRSPGGNMRKKHIPLPGSKYSSRTGYASEKLQNYLYSDQFATLAIQPHSNLSIFHVGPPTKFWFIWPRGTVQKLPIGLIWLPLE